MGDTSTRFANFILDVFDYKFNDTTQAETFKVRVLDSPSGQRGFADATEVTLAADVRESLFGLDKRRLSRKELIAFGMKLADALFPPACREMLEHSRPSAQSGFDVLRIQLRLNALELSNIPWEYSYIARPGTPPGQEDLNGFLVLDRSLSLVRFEQLRQAVDKFKPSDGQPLRMVMVTANPDHPPYQKLTQIDNEVANVGKIVDEINAKSGGIIRYELFQNATVDNLVDAFAAPADIFHFAGHGRFKKSPGGSLDAGGAIVLMGDGDGDGDIVEFSADRLAGLLRRGGDRGVKLAVLGACEVGRRDGVNAWTGVVPALIRAGIPAVVGMQFTIGDANAKEFSRAFYRALAAGETFDDAVALGRQAIFLKSADPDERDWGVPVLYLRAEGEKLLPSTGVSVSAAQIDSNPPNKTMPDKVTLRTFIAANFNLRKGEFDLLCENLSTKYASKNVKVSMDDIDGSTAQIAALNLINYMDRRGWLPYLVEQVRADRPDLTL